MFPEDHSLLGEDHSAPNQKALKVEKGIINGMTFSIDTLRMESRKQADSESFLVSESLNSLNVNEKKSKRHEYLPLDDCYLELVNLFLGYAGPFLFNVISDLNAYRQHCINNNITPVKQLPMYCQTHFFILRTHRKPQEQNQDSLFRELPSGIASLSSMYSHNSFLPLDSITSLSDTRFLGDSSNHPSLAVPSDSGDIAVIDSSIFGNVALQQSQRIDNSENLS